jgi:hypothetical protein
LSDATRAEIISLAVKFADNSNAAYESQYKRFRDSFKERELNGEFIVPYIPHIPDY